MCVRGIVGRVGGPAGLPVGSGVRHSEPENASLRGFLEKTLFGVFGRVGLPASLWAGAGEAGRCSESMASAMRPRPESTSAGGAGSARIPAGGRGPTAEAGRARTPPSAARLCGAQRRVNPGRPPWPRPVREWRDRWRRTGHGYRWGGGSETSGREYVELVKGSRSGKRQSKWSKSHGPSL